MNLTLVCKSDNDLCHILQHNNVTFNRTEAAQEAIEHAPKGSGILILADGYPNTPTPVDLTVMEMARNKNQRVYLEFPSDLPDMEVGDIRGIEWERAVVSSDAFSSLEK
ncbi:MAG: hypothetical protein HN521_21345, partial [Candidatus Latescibacteria bacterium]|nr:hypothetical protein [Candidatus Latescibacterota bacterium]